MILIDMKCEKCNAEHNGSYGSGRFCSVKCSRSFATSLNRNKINEAVSKSLTGRGMGYSTIRCNFCNVEFDTLNRRPKRYCSNSCCAKHRASSVENNQKLRELMLRKVRNGTHSGWKSRKGKPLSYAEKFFVEVLNNNGISFEHDLLVGRWFVDFAIKDKMIALEIDGKQHEMPERKTSDKLKDEHLLKSGWKVHRIKWKNIDNQIGSEYIKNEINKFLELYRGVG